MSKHKSKSITRREALVGSLTAAAVAAAGPSQAMAAPQAPGRLRGKRVLLGISDFSESLEVLYIKYRLMEEDIVPVIIAPKRKRVEMVIHYGKPGYLSYIEAPGYPIDVDVATKDVNPAEYDGLILPGGRGPEKLRMDKAALNITNHFLDNKRPLGAMCHGVMLLYTGRTIKGRRMAAYSGIRTDIEAAGGIFVDEPVVVDGALVTSRSWGDLHKFMPAFLKVLARG